MGDLSYIGDETRRTPRLASAASASGSAEPTDGDEIGARLDALQDRLAAELVLRPRVIIPSGFERTATGWFRQPRGAEGEPPPPPVRIAAPFEIMGETRDSGGDEWGIALRFDDRDGRPHDMVLSQRQLSGPEHITAAELRAKGLAIEPGEERYVARLLMGLRHPRRLEIVARAGWHDTADGKTFVLPDGRAFGPDAESMMIQGVGKSASAFASMGDLASWQDAIGRLAVGNNALALFLALGLTGPVMELVSEPSGGVHLVGKSRGGKTTCAKAAASLWGPPERQVKAWRATTNALEGTAAVASDTVLILDEIGQAPAADLADAVYLLGNGAGKGRADRMGNLRVAATWRVFVISTGEISVPAALAEAGKRARVGVDMRLISIGLDADGGAFPALHGFANQAALA